MNPEKNSSNINTSDLLHTGKLKNELQELPHSEDAPSIQDITNTGEIPQLIPEDSGALTLGDEERPAFQEKLAAQREYHELRTAESAEQKKKGKGKLFAILGATAAGAVTAASLFLLPKGENNANENKPTPTQPVATAEATPSQTASPNTLQTKEELIKSLEIKANQSDEKIAADVISLYSKWGMAGATEEAYKNQDLSRSLEEEAEKIANEQAPIYAEAMFGKDYNSDPSDVNTVRGMKLINKDNVWRYLATSGGTSLNPKNIEPWSWTKELVSLESSEDVGNSKTLTIKYAEYNNGGKNSIAEYPASGTQDTIHVTVKKSGDHYEVEKFPFE